jgi:hypothetical protein
MHIPRERHRRDCAVKRSARSMRQGLDGDRMVVTAMRHHHAGDQV